MYHLTKFFNKFIYISIIIDRLMVVESHLYKFLTLVLFVDHFYPLETLVSHQGIIAPHGGLRMVFLTIILVIHGFACGYLWDWLLQNFKILRISKRKVIFVWFVYIVVWKELNKSYVSNTTEHPLADEENSTARVTGRLLNFKILANIHFEYYLKMKMHCELWARV